MEKTRLRRSEKRRKEGKDLGASESRRNHQVRGDFDWLLFIIGLDVDDIGYSMIGNHICEILGFHECVPNGVRLSLIVSEYVWNMIRVSVDENGWWKYVVWCVRWCKMMYFGVSNNGIRMGKNGFE